MVSLHVAPGGKDSNPGSRKEPFGSLEQAREAIRGLRKQGWPKGGVTVWLEPGDYIREESFELRPEDGGMPDAPVVYRGRTAKRPRLIGGRFVSGFGRVTDEAVLARLTPAARERVVAVNLRAMGITSLGEFRSRGFGRGIIPAHLELFFDGRPMTVAQWPNAGDFTTIAGFVRGRPNEWKEEVGELADGFKYSGERPGTWKQTQDIWVHGYWCYDWANTYERVVRIDTSASTVVTADPYGCYAFKPGQRYYFLNILEELDEAGEYVVDRESGMLYFWPPAPVKGREALTSVLEKPLVKVAGASHVVLAGLAFEGGRASAVEVEGGAGVTIAACTIRNMGNLGVKIAGGTDHAVLGCDISHTGDGTINLSGGDRKTLTQCHHRVENCHLHHYARWSRTYQAAIHAGGCGMRIAHNLIHDAPHNAILYWGNDMAIENNEIYRVCLETGDAGAIYTGRDYTFRGNVIRNNFIHHMGGVGMGTSAIYMDDCVSGHDISGNVVWGGDAVWLGGGRDFRIHDNVFIHCKGAVCFDARGVSEHVIWQNMVNNTMRESLEAMNWREPPYAERFPELAPIAAHLAAGKGIPPENNRAERNLCVGVPPVRMGWTGSLREDWLLLRDNVEESEPGFVGPEWGDFRLKPDAPVLSRGIRAVDMDQIGLKADTWRPNLPGKVRSSLRLTAIEEGKARMRLSLRNDGPTVGRGRMLIPLSHERTIGVQYRLKPGALVERDFTMPVRPGRIMIGAHDQEGDARPARCLVAVPVMCRRIQEQAIGGAAALRGALRLPVETDGDRLGVMRMAIKGERLLIRVDVSDPMPIRGSELWNGSSVEIFLSADDHESIFQLVLAPPTSAESAAIGRFMDGKRQAPPKSVNARFRRRAGGYVLDLSVPLSEADIGAGASSFRLDASLSVTRGGATVRRTLSGAGESYRRAAHYLAVSVVDDPQP